MISAMTIAASGMMAAQTSLLASASHIANMQSTGPLPAARSSASGASAAGSLYRQSLTAMSSIDLPREVVNQMEAVNAYKANIQVFKVADKTFKSLLDALA